MLAAVNLALRATRYAGLRGLTGAARRAGGVRFHEERTKETTHVTHYPISLAMVREVRPYADRIARFDRDLARQLRRSSTAVPLNLSGGSALRGGRRRQSYEIALGEARETLANLEASKAIGYIPNVDAQVRRQLGHIIGTLVKLVRLSSSGARLPTGVPDLLRTAAQ